MKYTRTYKDGEEKWFRNLITDVSYRTEIEKKILELLGMRSC